VIARFAHGRSQAQYGERRQLAVSTSRARNRSLLVAVDTEAAVNQFLSAMAVFIQYPYLAALLGVILLALGLRTRHRTPVVIGVIWLLYALYETGMQQRWLCTGECNIRIDLLVIYPVLLIGLLAAGVSLLRPSSSRRPPT
jgi:hypothetical protein